MIILILRKMKTSIYKSGFLLLLALTFTGLSLQAQEVSKEYHKEYSANQNTSLSINNKYGDVVVSTWDRNQIVIDVKVTILLPNREKAEKLMSYIDVIFTEEGENISARTFIDERFGFTGWGNSSRRFSIDYTVNMPEGNDLAVTNRYGDTELGEHSGKVSLDIKYGDLKAIDLTRGNVKPLSYLNIAYGKADIDRAGWLDVTARYSGSLRIGRSQALLLDSRYSKLNLEETSSVVADSKYDNIRIGTMNNLVMDCGYADIVIGTLSRKLVFDGQYGSFTIEQIPEKFEDLEVRTKYTGVRLGIASSADYELDARLSYGDLRFDSERFRHTRQIIENTSKEYSGIMGEEESPAARVSIVASYGTVRLD